MPRPIQAIIHPLSLRNNLDRARQAAPDAKVWAVVKANAYGHGIERCFDGLRSADGFAVLDLTEAQRLRSLDWRGPILLLEGIFEPRDLELCSRLKLWHVIHSSWQVDALAQHKTHEPHRVFLKLNTGMNRLGFQPAAFRGAWARLSAMTQVDEISVMTHFANADVTDGIDAPLQKFHEFTHDLEGERSLCNSAALLRHGHDALIRGDWVRPGIMLYGSSPDYPEHSSQDWQLQPSMSLRSQVIAVQELQVGDAVGYGSQFVALHPMRIGVVACGYADGYPRVAPSGTPVLVGGHRTGTVGRVSMDMLAVDLQGLPQVQVGAEVTLWGCSQNGTVLPIDEVAHAAGTLGYELMCAVTPRVTMLVDTESHEPSFS